MFCPNCAAEIRGGIRFCSNCGTAIPQAPVEQVSQQQSSNNQPKAPVEQASQQQSSNNQPKAPVAAPVAPPVKEVVKTSAFCVKCGTEVTGLKVCPNCGKHLSKTVKNVVIIGLFAILTVVLALSVYFNFDQYYDLVDAYSENAELEYAQDFVDALPEDVPSGVISTAYTYFETHAVVANNFGDFYHRVNCEKFNPNKKWTVFTSENHASQFDYSPCPYCFADDLFGDY